MIKLYYFHTPNVFKVLIALAEMGLEYKEQFVDILNGEQLKSDFLAINPNNKLPAIEDLEPADGGSPIPVFESGAILLYLAEKTGQLLPQTPRGKAEVMKWVFWQAANQGPHMGLLGHYTNFTAEHVPYAIEKHRKEVDRLFRVMNTQLEGRQYLAGEYSIADIMNYPWIRLGASLGMTIDQFSNIQRWFDDISDRPAVKAALTAARVNSLAEAVEDSRPQ